MSKTPEQIRLEQKLELWQCPGFFQFINDLANYCGTEINLLGNAAALKKIYQARIEELQPKGPFKQGKLDI